jgi:ubiquinone/menaquinone biosynthesis C-methylase UbiE
LRQKGFNAVIGDVLALPFGNNVSDLTVCIGVIHHTDDPFKAFSELARITKPGGYIYLNVYNKLNPYYYLVHRATFPIRYCYWNYSRKVVDIVYPISKLLFQPLAYVTLGKFLDDKTGKTMFMDQVITPRAHLFSKSMLDSYAHKCGCMVEKYMYNRYFLKLSAIIRAN